MLRYLLLLFFGVVLYANTMDDVLKYYNNKNFLSTYQELKNMELDQLEDPKLYFYLGRSAFELKKPKEALEAYNKALALEPQNIRTRLEKARTLFTLNDYKNAKKEFELVLLASVPDNVKTNVERYLESIKKKTQKHFYSGALMLGIGHDNNVLNSSFEGIAFEFNGIPIPNSAEAKRSAYHQEIFMFNHQYRFTDIANLSWESSFIAYNQGYKTAGEANIFVTGLTSGASYVKGDFKYSLPLSYHIVRYGGENYLDTMGIAPKVDYLFSKTVSLNVALNLQQKRYQQAANKDRNAKYKELSLGLNQLLFGSDLLSVKAIYAHERKDRGTLVDVDKNRRAFQLSYMKKFSERYNASFAYNYYKDVFQDKLFGLVRNDANKNINIKLGAKINDKLLLNLSYNYIDNDSTINAYTYKKSNYLLTLMVTF